MAIQKKAVVSADEKASSTKGMDLPPMRTANISFGIVGMTPLIVHAWDPKMRSQLAKAKPNRTKGGHLDKDPEAEARLCLYLTEDGSLGFSLLAFKDSLIKAAHKDIGLEKTVVRKAFFLPPVPNMVVPLIADDYVIREDIVRIGGGSPDIRYRPEFAKWRVELTGTLDLDLMSLKSFAALVERAGFGVGVCEWRPEKGGEYGRFRLDPNVPFRCDIITAPNVF